MNLHCQEPISLNFQYHIDFHIDKNPILMQFLFTESIRRCPAIRYDGIRLLFDVIVQQCTNKLCHV